MTNDEKEPEVIERKKPEPLPVDPGDEVLDWDAYVPPPPPKRKGTIQVRLVYKGRAKPMPVPDPEEE